MRYLSWVFIALLVLVLPNPIWLGTSMVEMVYVEGSFYHIDAHLSGPDEAACTYADPFASLFLVKALG